MRPLRRDYRFRLRGPRHRAVRWQGYRLSSMLIRRPPTLTGQIAVTLGVLVAVNGGGMIISLGCRETVMVRLLGMPTLQHLLRQSQGRAALAESPPVIMLLIVRFST